MTENEIRLECLRLASLLEERADAALEYAERYADFVMRRGNWAISPRASDTQ